MIVALLLKTVGGGGNIRSVRSFSAVAASNSIFVAFRQNQQSSCSPSFESKLHPLRNREHYQQQRWFASSSGGGDDNNNNNKDKSNNKTKKRTKPFDEETVLRSVEDDEVYFEEIDYALNPEKVKHRIDRSKFTVPVTVKMPDVGQTTGKIKKWYHEPGDIIMYQFVLADIETPDFTFGLDVENEDVGIFSEILVQPNVNVPPGTPICVIMHQSDDDPDLDPDLEPITDYSDEAQAQRRERIAKKKAEQKQSKDFEE